MVGWGGFAHLVISLPPPFPIPLPFPNPPSNTPFLLHNAPRWARYPLGVMVVEGEAVAAQGLVARSSLGLTEFLAPSHFACLAAPSINSVNSLKY
jgi:hypothetical protein